MFMNLSTTHVVTSILAVLITMAPGIYAARKIKNADDYAVGGRSSGIGMVAAAILGTLIGGGSTMGTAQMAYKIGFSAWWFTLGGGIALIILGLFYARSLRSSGLTTVGEFLVTNFGTKAGVVASVSASAGMFFSVVTSTLSVTHLLCLIFPLQPWQAGIVIFVIVGCFVFFGGMSGSGLVGLCKMGFILLGLFVGGVICYVDMGGVQGIKNAFPAFPWFSLVANGEVATFITLMSMIVGVISTQSYAQAVFSAADTRCAALACLIAGGITIPVGIPSILIGMYMRLHHPDILPIEALPMFLITYLPDWLGGVGIAALLLATLGTIAGLTLGMGTLFARDIVKRFTDIKEGEKLLLATRLGVAVACLAAIVFTNFNLDSNALDWSYLSMALRGSGIFLPLTFCIFFPHKVKPLYGLLSMAAGIFIGLTWKFIGISGVHPLIPALGANLVFLLLGFRNQE